MFLYTSTYYIYTYIYRHVCVKLGLSIGYINLVFVGCIRWNDGSIVGIGKPMVDSLGHCGDREGGS